MAAFLFQIELPPFTEAIVHTIPQQRSFMNKLFIDGRLLSYSVAEHRTLIWCVISAADEQEAMATVLQFPLYRYFTDVVCHPLLFHNMLPISLPDISLN